MRDGVLFFTYIQEPHWKGYSKPACLRFQAFVSASGPATFPKASPHHPAAVPSCPASNEC